MDNLRPRTTLHAYPSSQSDLFLGRRLGLDTDSLTVVELREFRAGANNARHFMIQGAG